MLWALVAVELTGVVKVLRVAVAVRWLTQMEFLLLRERGIQLPWGRLMELPVVELPRSLTLQR